MANILIGGFGRVGHLLSEHLVGKGHSVTAIRRSLETNDKVKCVQMDLCDPGSFSCLQKDFDLALYILTPSERNESGYRKIYIDGLKNLLSHLKYPQCPVIFVSSTSVYGQQSGEWVDEDSETLPDNFRGQVLLEAEKLVLQERNGMVVRFSGIYSGQSERLLKSLSGDEGIQDDPPVYTNRIHLKDCAGVLFYLMERILAGDGLEQVYLASDLDPAPRFEVLSLLAEVNGLPLPKRAKGSGGKQNKRCSSRRLQELGYSFMYPSYKQGYTDRKE